MYRLCRLFVSDITAGENLLRNGFVPIFRENARADHGVLFAVNGTCKTTLLSFILNVFCPDQRRFVQHLQSGGDKTLEQYLIPGRPAVALVDLAVLLPPDLFEEQPMEHLVLGQLIYRHRGAQDKVDRTFFIARSEQFFDLLRRQWDHLLAGDQPYKRVRDFMADHVQQTTSQKEWADNLERLGLDPWLIDRQIDFARTEGGIKDTFKFHSESDFLSFFLGCVSDMEAAAGLRETIGQSLRKMADRPRKMAQLKVARGLRERIAHFDEIARNWRAASDSMADRHAQLGEAAHLLQAAEKTAEGRSQTLTPALVEAQAQRDQTLARMQTIRADILAVRRFQLDERIATAQEELKKNCAEIDRSAAEDAALQAADYQADLRRKRAEADNKRAALLQANAELAPKLRKVEALAAQYHVRLDHERHQVGGNIKALRDKMREAEKSGREIEQQRTTAVSRRNALDQEHLRIGADIQAAEARCAALALDAGENPLDAKKRLREAIAAVEARIHATRGTLMALDEELQNDNRRWVKMQADRSDLEVRLRQARERMAAESLVRSRLLEDPHLKRMAGSPTFEPTAAELLSRLDGAIARGSDRLAEKERDRLALQNELERLARSESLAADEQTQRLIAHYHQTGVSSGELKSFPEYLAELYEAPEKIARFIEADPGRFTGMMAANAGVIDTVQRLPVPEWLQRPVVISTPCAPEAISDTAHTIIRPPDPQIYSKSRMAAVRGRLRAELEVAGREIDAQSSVLWGLRQSSRKLHAYRETYPDEAAVTGLTDQVVALENGLMTLTDEIAAGKAATESRRERRAGQEELHRQLTADLARLTERSDQVARWLELYADLETWQREYDELTASRVESDKHIASIEESQARTREEIGRLKGDIRVQETKLLGLDDRAGDVPRPGEDPLSAADREDALEMDLQSLRALHESAREDQRQMAGDLGIDALQKELSMLQEAIAREEAVFRAFGRDNPYDEHLVKAWAARGLAEREERRRTLRTALDTLRRRAYELEAEIKYQGKQSQELAAQLADEAQKGIIPDVAEVDFAGQDADGLLHRFRSQESRHGEAHARLTARCRELDGQLKILQAWHHEIQLATAETQAFAPHWDNHSPRVPWTDLRAAEGQETRMDTVQAMRRQVHDLLEAERRDHSLVQEALRKMSTAYQRLQLDLQGDAYKQHLPAVIDELRRHDPESLGTQGRELMQRCEEIARNIETDLEISQRLVDNLVDMLLQRSREYHQKLQAAAQETIPADVFIYGGKPILRAGTRLDFAKHKDVFRQTVENWLYELMQQDRLPEVNPKAGNCLGSELLLRLLGAASGKKQFGIRLLKCDDTGRNYEAVGKDLGSGGEALTTAVLLYALLISMRKRRRGSIHDRIPAFLVLDNPLGVCNRADFLDAQLKVARSMGIQCVYLTGINDRESLDLFELRVAIRKADKKLAIDSAIYDCLEIIELNVENRHGPYLA